MDMPAKYVQHILRKNAIERWFAKFERHICWAVKDTFGSGNFRFRTRKMKGIWEAKARFLFTVIPFISAPSFRDSEILSSPSQRCPDPKREQTSWSRPVRLYGYGAE